MPATPASAAAISTRRLSLLVASLTAIGPFAIDTYLPAFGLIGESLGAGDVEVQQTLSIYLLTFAAMNLWHGALSDSLGRRTVLLAGLAVFAVGNVGAALSTSIGQLWFWRAIQGLAGGIGLAVGRAAVRDMLHGADAQRVLAQVTMLFALAPAVAPIIGGWIGVTFGWRAIFGFLAVLAAAIFLSTWRFLPETLPPERRQSLHPGNLLRGYSEVFRLGALWRLAGAQALSFLGFFVYILASPVFLTEHLKLSATQFGWLFVPATTGTMLGGFLASRFAGRRSLDWAIRAGLAIMGVTALINVALNWNGPPALVLAVTPIMFYSIGMSLAQSSFQVRMLDLAPSRTGMVSSCGSFIMHTANALAAALLVPLLWGSSLHLAAGSAALAAAAVLLYAWQCRRPVPVC
ncbi:MAG: multidrug effflux MFS transporter [Lautropia sp.]